MNVSGGSLGCGYTYDMSGLRSVLEVVLQLRGVAGERQVHGVRVGLAQSWRGIPTASGGVAVLGTNDGDLILCACKESGMRVWISELKER